VRSPRSCRPGTEPADLKANLGRWFTCPRTVRINHLAERGLQINVSELFARAVSIEQSELFFESSKTTISALANMRSYLPTISYERGVCLRVSQIEGRNPE
jgi:hypothetical protein